MSTPRLALARAVLSDPKAPDGERREAAEFVRSHPMSLASGGYVRALVLVPLRDHEGEKPLGSEISVDRHTFEKLRRLGCVRAIDEEIAS